MDAFSLKQHPRPFGVGLSDNIKNKLRTNALEKTVFYDISHVSRLLPQLDPALAVHPQLETLDFYKEFGGSRRDIEDYAPESSAMQHMQESERKDGKRKTAMLEEILQNFHIGQISFVGQAGSGKTTLLKAITREIIEGKHKNLRDIEVVHFVHLRSFRRNQMVTPAELLFRNVTPEMSDTEMKEAVTFAKENPDKVIFVLDSLDTIPYTIDGVYTSVSLDDRCSPEPILYHLLSGSLLPGCRFITSSREYAMRNYKGEIRAKQVIALAGLTKESMGNIIAGYLGEDGAKQTMAYLETKPLLESLCATPVWLIFTLMVRNSNSDFKPNTMAGTLVVLLQSMIRSEHTHEKHIEVVVDKLGVMAFTGTMERRVEFSNIELSYFGLEEGEVADLVVMTPSGRYQNIILGDTILIFAHQCLQEILTAFRLAKMELEEFKYFINNHIHKAHFAVVRRLLAGILLNKNVFEASENLLEGGENFEQKKVLLKKSLEKELQNTMSNEYWRSDVFELFLTLSEADGAVKDIIQKNVHELTIRESMISPGDGFSIGWVMSQRIFVKTLRLTECNPSSASLSALYHAVKGANVQLHEIHIAKLGISEMSILGKFVTQCNVSIFKVTENIPKPQALRAFLDSSVGAKLKELDVSSDIKGSSNEKLLLYANIVKQCNANVLRIQRSNLNKCLLTSFLKNSVDLRLRELDLSGNQNLGPDEMYVVTQIIKQCKVKVLVAQRWGFSLHALKSFLDYSGGIELEVLDFSLSGTLASEQMSLLAKIAKRCGVHTLKCRRCKLTEDALESFLESSIGLELRQLDFSVSRNLSLGAAFLIGKIVKQCKVSIVNISGTPKRSLSMEGLKAFVDSTIGSKIMTLDLRGNRNIFKDGGYSVGRLMKQCGIENAGVLLRDIHLLNEKYFEDSLVNRKLITLNMVDSDIFWEITENQVETLCKLLPFVKREIDISGCGISQKLEVKLQSELDAGNVQDLKIIYGQSLPYKTMRCGTFGSDENNISEDLEKEITVVGGPITVADCNPIQRVIRDDQRGQERYLLESHIYMSHEMPEFALGSHLCNGLLRDSFHAKMTSCGFHPKRHFNPIHAMSNDNIQVVLSCRSPPGFSFYPNGTLNLTIDQDFFHKEYCHTTILLKKNSNAVTEETLIMEGHIEKEGDIVHDILPFYYKWLGLTQTRRRSAGPSREAAQNDSSDESDLGPQRKKTKTMRPTSSIQNATAFRNTGHLTVNVQGDVNVHTGVAEPSVRQEFEAQHGESRTSNPIPQTQLHRNSHGKLIPVSRHTMSAPSREQHQHQNEPHQSHQTQMSGQSVNVPLQEQQQQNEQQQQAQQTRFGKIHPGMSYIRTVPEHDHLLFGAAEPPEEHAVRRGEIGISNMGMNLQQYGSNRGDNIQQTMLGTPETSEKTLFVGVPEVLQEAENVTLRASWAELREAILRRIATTSIATMSYGTKNQ